MNHKLRLFLIIFFSCTLVFSAVKIVQIQLEYRRADKIYQNAREENFQILDSEDLQTEDEEVFPNVDIDIAVLVQKNPDIIGWLWIPETEISYPLLHGADNQYYLNSTYDLTYSPSGSIFMDYRNGEELRDDNSVIYGHNMNNNTMFGDLKEYMQSDYLKEHKDIYIYTRRGAFKYRAFSAYQTLATSDSYTLKLGGEKGFRAFLESRSNRTEDTPAEQFPLLTLSTCTNGQELERYVLHAALIAEQS